MSTEIYDVMVEATHNQWANHHTIFDQGSLKFFEKKGGQRVERKKGLCAGLCIRWIKSANPERLLGKLRNPGKHQPMRDAIADYQVRSIGLKRDAIIPSRTFRSEGGFGSLAVRQMGQSVLYFLDNEKMDLSKQRGYRFKEGRKLRQHVAFKVASDYEHRPLAALIDLDFYDDPESSENTPGHNVALRTIADEVAFLDPNGGALSFNCKRDFRDWFIDEFGKVTEPVPYSKADMRVQLYSYNVVAT